MLSNIVFGLLSLGEGGHGSDTFSFIANSSEPSLCSDIPNMLIGESNDTGSLIYYANYTF